jgi:hypothetical protein
LSFLEFLLHELTALSGTPKNGPKLNSGDFPLPPAKLILINIISQYGTEISLLPVLDGQAQQDDNDVSQAIIRMTEKLGTAETLEAVESMLSLKQSQLVQRCGAVLQKKIRGGKP